MRKRQPEGGLIGFGGSPVSGSTVVRRSGSSVGFDGQQRAGVRVPRPAVDLFDRAGLDHAAEIHHQHAIGDVFHHVQVVRNEQIGQVQPRLELGQQVEHLCLDRFVQRGDGFVEDDETGLERERTRDVDALTLAAGQLVRVAAGELCRVEADLAKELFRARRRLAGRQAVHAGA